MWVACWNDVGHIRLTCSWAKLACSYFIKAQLCGPDLAHQNRTEENVSCATSIFCSLPCSSKGQYAHFHDQEFPTIIIIIYPLTMRVVRAPQMISQPVSSIFPCSPLPSGTWRTPGLSIPWCCLPTCSSVCLVFFPLSLCLAKWFWLDLMNGRHDHTTAVCVSLQWSGGLRVVWLLAGSFPC